MSSAVTENGRILKQPLRSRAPRRALALGAAAMALVGAPGSQLAGEDSAAASLRRAVIGHSVRGRALVASVSRGLGAGPRILVVGSIHGDERAGTRVTRRLIRGRRPRRAELWVLPTLNPDGLAASTRGNAKGVDLNRNFPFGWQRLGGLEYSGPRPLSEPEARAAVTLIRSLRPAVTIWFHQPFGLVDRSGGNAALERRYSQLTGLPLVGLRRYPGSATSWQNHAIPKSTAFVVELPAIVSDRLVRRAALAVVRLIDEQTGADLAPAKAAH